MSDENGDSVPEAGASASPGGGGELEVGEEAVGRFDEAGSVSAVLDELKITLQDLASGEVVGSLWDEFRRLRATVETLLDEADVAAAPAAPAVDTSQLDAELRAVRTRVEDIIARLDEGLDLDIDASALLPAADAAPAPSTDGTSKLADQVAALHDLVRTEFDAIRRQLRESGLEGSGAESAALDPDTLDLLREEIRASGTPSAELIDTLNTELKALRRRIKLRAEGEIFSDEQLELIADAVARRLAEKS
ncbi:MAG: hypothetical protein U5K30_06155 [Acidimicrobiales bacterium]|nr:hypothetical protein [Acidimicrobiales bacterium]